MTEFHSRGATGVLRGKGACYLDSLNDDDGQLAKALYTSDILHVARFVSMQNHYNLCYREEEREMTPLCRDQGIGLLGDVPYRPSLLSGLRPCVRVNLETFL